MPARRILAVATFLMILSIGAVLSPSSHTLASTQPRQHMTPVALSTGIDSAILWLAQAQAVNGSYGSYYEDEAAAAALAFSSVAPNSVYANRSYSFLASQLNSSSTWFWGQYGEADFPGFVFYALGSGSRLSHINMTLVQTNLLQFQKSSGGFAGYYDASAYQNVPSSVDTDMALLGMIIAHEIPAKNETNAVNYLLSLQNSDGSFNLTSTKSFDPIDALGPDLGSTTALTLLALHAAGDTQDSPNVSKGLVYLNTKASSNFSGHIYAASLATLAFEALGESGNGVVSSEYVLSRQDRDGGFNDIARTSPSSNPLDTGLAVLALHTGFIEENKVAPVNTPSLPNGFIAARAIILLKVAVAIIVGIGVYIVLQRNKRSNYWQTFLDFLVQRPRAGHIPVHHFRLSEDNVKGHAVGYEAKKIEFEERKPASEQGSKTGEVDLSYQYSAQRSPRISALSDIEHLQQPVDRRRDSKRKDHPGKCPEEIRKNIYIEQSKDHSRNYSATPSAQVHVSLTDRNVESVGELAVRVVGQQEKPERRLGICLSLFVHFLTI